MAHDHREPVPLRPHPEAVLNETILTLGLAADTARRAGDDDVAHRCVHAVDDIAQLRTRLREERGERAA